MHGVNSEERSKQRDGREVLEQANNREHEEHDRHAEVRLRLEISPRSHDPMICGPTDSKGQAMKEQELIMTALLKGLRDEWPEETPVADMVRRSGVTADEISAVEKRFPTKGRIRPVLFTNLRNLATFATAPPDSSLQGTADRRNCAGARCPEDQGRARPTR